ncbi:hypothetical protein ABPG74_020905 [Tetrahymena malaccensis]
MSSENQTPNIDIQIPNTINSQRNRNAILLSIICVCLLAIGLSLYFGLTQSQNDNGDPFEKSLYIVDRKFQTQKQQNYKFELHTIHVHQNNDSSKYSREILAFVDQTKQYEVEQTNSTVILPGARDFIDINSPQNQQSTQSSTTNNTNQDNQRNSSKSDDLPFSDDDIDLSRAEIIQFNVTRGGEMIDISFPCNVNETFLFNLPSFLSALLPNLLKSNYDQVDSKGIKVSQRKDNLIQKNAHGTYKMSVMQSHKASTGDVTLIQQFVQKTDTDYKQVIQQQSNITFNNQGQLVKGNIQSSQKFQYVNYFLHAKYIQQIISFSFKDNSTEDVLKNQQISQKFNVTFINETSISNDQRTHINNVYNLMNKIQYNWTDYLVFLDNLKKTDVQLDNTLITSNQTEKPLVGINQTVDLSHPNTRMLTQNNDLLDSLNVQLFSKSILTIKMTSFISFQCQKPQDTSQNDVCKSQIFLQFLGLNIPVSPIQTVNFPLTQFKNKVYWLKKNSLLMVSKIKNNVIDQISNISNQINQKINLAQNLFSSLQNPNLNDIQQYASIITSNISGQLLDQQQKLQTQYNQILNATQNKVNILQDIASSAAKQYLTTLKNKLPEVQKNLIDENEKLLQIYQDKSKNLYAVGILEVQNMQISLQKTIELIQDTVYTQIKQNIIKLIQEQQDIFMNSVLSYMNSQQLKLNNTVSKFAQDIQKKIILLTQNSFYNIFQVQLKQMSNQINDSLLKPIGEIQQQFNQTKQNINIINVKTNKNEGKKFVHFTDKLKPTQDIEDQLQERRNAIQNIQNNLNSLISTSLDQLKSIVVSNYTQIMNITNQEITSKITNVTDVFANITQQSILSLKDKITILKNKTQDYSFNVTQKLQNGIDSLFSQVDGYDKQITTQADQALKMLQVDFSQSNFKDSVKQQLGESAQTLTDDITDQSLKSFNLTNLQDGNLFDFPVKSYVNGIQSLINNGTNSIKDTIDQVKNVQSSFNDLSKQFKQISQVALNFSQYENSFLQINKNFEDILNQVDLQNLFQTITEDLKQDLINYIQSEIIDNIQKQAIDQVKSKFEKLGNQILKENLNKAVKKLENVNKLFEMAIMQISSKFQFDKEKKILFDKQLKFPENPWPYFIPTPIGIPLVLQYYFQFGAQIFTYIDIQGTSISAGFQISANAEFDASASLSVAIAEVGAYAKGTIISGDIRGLIKIELLQKQNLSFIVDGTFKALNLKASIYIQYIKVKMIQKCVSIIKFRNLKKKKWGRIIKTVVKTFTPSYGYGPFIAALHIGKNNAGICFQVPESYKSEKQDILPPLNIKGAEGYIVLVNQTLS